MKLTLLPGLLLACLSLTCQAHEVWIERDNAGPVRIYFGEPAQEVADHGDDELKRLVAPRIFGTEATATTPPQRNGDHLSVALDGDGDAWLFDNAVFAPWQGENGQYEAVTYYARAGRQSTAGKLDFELVPLTANGDRLTLLYRGKPLSDAEVTVIDPHRRSKLLKSDGSGQITLPALGQGRHILVAGHKQAVETQIDGKPVRTMHHISTLTFRVD